MENERAGIPMAVLMRMKQIRIAGEAVQPLMHIFTETYGKGMSKAFISNSSFIEQTGMLPQAFIRARTRLLQMNIIKVQKGQYGALYEINEPSKWKSFDEIKPETGKKLTKVLTAVNNNVNTEESIKTDTKINKFEQEKAKNDELTKSLTPVNNNVNPLYINDLSIKNNINKQEASLEASYKPEEKSGHKDPAADCGRQKNFKLSAEEEISAGGRAAKVPVKRTLQTHKNPGHRLLGYWSEKFFSRVKARYVPTYKRDVPVMNRLVANYGEDGGRQMIDVFFRLESDVREWQHGKPTIAVFCKSWEQILSWLRDNAKAAEELKKQSAKIEKAVVDVKRVSPPVDKMMKELRAKYGEAGAYDSERMKEYEAEWFWLVERVINLIKNSKEE